MYWCADAAAIRLIRTTMALAAPSGVARGGAAGVAATSGSIQLPLWGLGRARQLFTSVSWWPEGLGLCHLLDGPEPGAGKTHDARPVCGARRWRAGRRSLREGRCKARVRKQMPVPDGAADGDDGFLCDLGSRNPERAAGRAEGLRPATILGSLTEVRVVSSGS